MVAENQNMDGSEKKGSRSSVLFGPIGLVFLLIVVICAGWYDRKALLLLTGTMLVVICVTWSWSRLSLMRVFFDRRLSAGRAFPGDRVELRLVVENRKILPLAWIEGGEEVPAVLAPEEGGQVIEDRPDKVRLSKSCALLWYRRAVMKHELFCRRRGYYPLGPGTVSSGDIFGFFPNIRKHDGENHLIVYPKVFELQEIVMPSKFPIGENKAESRLFEDPTRTIGLRQYTREVPFKNIHWKASARNQELQVKTFEPTTTLEVFLFLETEGFDTEEEFEFGLSLAASLAKHMLDERRPVGCFTNAASARPGRGTVSIGSGCGPEHLMLILEALAVVKYAVGRPFDDFIQEQRRRLTWGATLCLITGRMTETTGAFLREIQRNGFPVTVYQTGPDPIPVESFPCRVFQRTGPADDPAPGVCEGERP